MSSGVLRTSIGGNGTFVIRNAANDANNIVLDPNGTGTFEGDVTLSDGSNLVLENAAENRTVSINADDATTTYNITLPPTTGTANQLRAAGIEVLLVPISNWSGPLLVVVQLVVVKLTLLNKTMYSKRMHRLFVMITQ